jgi:hypothetical protein
MEVNKMKIYAKQVPPEYQESPLFMEDWPENVFVFGNRHYTAHAGRLEDIKRALEDISDVCNGYGYTNNLFDVIPGRDDGREYTRPERLQLVRLAKNYTEYSNNSDDENEILCDVLELITGRAWEYSTIRGCCQGDWQEIIYPAEYGREWLSDFETEYFNTGAEWRISENDPENDDNFYMYTHAWSDDGIRAEIAAAAGVDPGDVVLYQFTGWSKTPEYKEVS